MGSLTAEPMFAPVEAGAQVVHKPSKKPVSSMFKRPRIGSDLLAGKLCADLASKIPGLLKIGLFGFQPDHVGIGSKGDCALDGGLDKPDQCRKGLQESRYLNTTGNVVVPLLCARNYSM